MKQGWIQATTSITQENLSPKVLADTVYMDETEGETIKDAIASRGPTHFQAAFPADGWSESAPYTQSVPVEGLLETDAPITDVALDSDPEIALEELEAYGLVGRMEAENGQVTAYCYEEAPRAEFTVRLMVMR